MERRDDSTCVACGHENNLSFLWDKLKNWKYFLLRKHVLNTIRSQVLQRTKDNPFPDNLEYKIGVFREMIEPQAREAVLSIIKKGYYTTSSGFDDWNPNYQELQGPFTISDEVEKAILAKGIEVIHPDQNWTWILWKTNTLDLNVIKNQWYELDQLFPKNNNNNIFVVSPSAEEFRNKYPQKINTK